MKIKQSVVAICVFGFGAFGLAGCSAAGEAESAENGEGTAQTEQAIGSVSCSTAAADQTFTGGINPTHVSPSSYNTCFRGYVVDVNNLSVTYTGVLPAGDDGYDANILVDWRGAVPTTQAACEAAWASAIFYKKVGGSWVDQSGVLQAYGEWNPGGGGLAASCNPPSISTLGSVTLQAGASYRVAATMRTSYGGATLRAIGITTRPRVIIH
ncbi:MAG TPA: hypothetical protein VER11_08725 [Polyangiaceae bacterium]|nr:hypothetical protein [Polyangiaceae bacterium]